LLKNLTEKEEDVEYAGIYKEGKYKKIQDFKNGDFRKLDKCLLKLQIFVGAMEPMEDDTVTDLMEFLQDEFHEFSIFEIENAIKMAIAGSLDVDKVEHIRYFNSVFLAKILIQYRIERSKVILKYQKGEDIVAQELKDQYNRENADKNNAQIMKELCITGFDNFKEGKTMMGFVIIGINVIYNYLTESGIIKHTPKELADFEKKAEELMKLNSMTDKRLFLIIKNKETTSQTEYQNHKDLEFKNVVVTNYFRGLINTKKDMRDIFEPKTDRIGYRQPITITKISIGKTSKKN